MRIQNAGACILLTIPFFTACNDAADRNDSESLACTTEENSAGNGCALDCEDGWHKGPDDTCVLDCPPMTEAQSDGSCSLVCKAGSSPTDSAVNTGMDKVKTTICVKECPENMVPDGSGCTIPCPEGWREDESGRCTLDCPDGMVPTDDGIGCAFETVGESKTCPDSKWDTSIGGPSPLFVDPEADPESADGSEDAPFATIGDAVAAMEDEATVYLAAGTYDEQVIVDTKKTFNLIGVCAEKVMIAPSSQLEFYPDENTDAGAVMLWKVDNLHIHGITAKSEVRNGIKASHDFDAVDLGIAQVDNVAVTAAEKSAVSIRGNYSEISVTHSTISAGQTGVFALLNFTDDVLHGDALPQGLITIRENDISNLTAFDEALDSVGIYAMSAEQADISDNLVRNIEYAVGITANMTVRVNLDRNIVSDISGFAGVHVIGPTSEKTPCELTARDNIITDILAGPCSWGSCPHSTVGLNIDTINGPGPYHTVLERNRIVGVQGAGVELSPARVEGNSLSVRDSQFSRCAEAVTWGAGDLTVSGSRFSENWGAIHGNTDKARLLAGDLTLIGNVFEDRLEDPSGLPEKYQDAYIYGVVFVVGEKGRGEMRAEGNLFRNNRAFEKDLENYMSVLQLSGETVSVTDNAFFNNEGSSVYIDTGDVVVSNNIFRDNQYGLDLIQGPDFLLSSAEVTSNEFISVTSALGVSWQETSGAFSFRDNLFFNGNLMMGTTGNLGTFATSAQFENNVFNFISMQLIGIEDLSVSDNLFENSSLVTAAQPERSETRISKNRFDRSSLAMIACEGETTVSNNEIVGPDRINVTGAGVGVYASPGLTTLKHNIIRGFETTEVKDVGRIGDGVHVVGIPGAETCDVWIESNRISHNGRFGVLLSNAAATMRVNMYLENGNSERSDLVFYQPVDGDIHGTESTFAVEAKSPPVVNDPQIRYDTLY